MSEPVIILEPGEKRAQQIARALSSRTAGKILDLLSDGPRPLSYIAEQLEIPLPQVKYHVDNLLDVGILEVTEEKYSVKGRRVKIYGLKHQVLVVAPKMVNLKAMLLKYSSVFGLFLLATLAIAAIRGYFLSLSPPRYYWAEAASNRLLCRSPCSLLWRASLQNLPSFSYFLPAGAWSCSQD